jgi:hypothetical protein
MSWNIWLVLESNWLEFWVGAGGIWAGTFGWIWSQMGWIELESNGLEYLVGAEVKWVLEYLVGAGVNWDGISGWRSSQIGLTTWI